MEVTIVDEKDISNGESSFKFEFDYTKEDLDKAATEPATIQNPNKDQGKY